jgi:hypothetical protein
VTTVITTPDKKMGYTEAIILPARHCDFNFGGGDGSIERVEISYRRHVDEAITVVHGEKYFCPTPFSSKQQQSNKLHLLQRN